MFPQVCAGVSKTFSQSNRLLACLSVFGCVSDFGIVGICVYGPQRQGDLSGCLCAAVLCVDRYAVFRFDFDILDRNYSEKGDSKRGVDHSGQFAVAYLEFIDYMHPHFVYCKGKQICSIANETRRSVCILTVFPPGDVHTSLLSKKPSLKCSILA